MTTSAFETADMLVPAESIESSPGVIATAIAQARAEQARGDAQEALTAAEAEEAGLRGRLAEIDARIDQVRQDLAGGLLTTAQAGGAVHLHNLDRADLDALLAQAVLASAECQATLQSAENACAIAGADLDKAEAKAEYDLVAARVREIESELCRAVGRAQSLGQRMGSPRLNQNWRPTPALLQIVRQIAVAGGVRI